MRLEEGRGQCEAGVPRRWEHQVQEGGTVRFPSENGCRWAEGG